MWIETDRKIRCYNGLFKNKEVAFKFIYTLVRRLEENYHEHEQKNVAAELDPGFAWLRSIAAGSYGI